MGELCFLFFRMIKKQTNKQTMLVVILGLGSYLRLQMIPKARTMAENALVARIYTHALLNTR